MWYSCQCRQRPRRVDEPLIPRCVCIQERRQCQGEWHTCGALSRLSHVRKKSTKMQSATFRKWLAERGCRFDQPEHERGEGQVMVTVHREGRTSQAVSYTH